MKLPSAALMIMTIGSLVGANAALAQATSRVHWGQTKVRPAGQIKLRPAGQIKSAL